MDSRKILGKYLKPHSAYTVISIVLLVAAVGMLIMGISSAANATTDAGEPAAFHAVDSERNEYVYLDVVAISNWLYKYDSATYYVAVDAEGYTYTVRVSNSDYNKMDAQYEYFITEDSDAVAPAPYRLKGLARTAGKELQETIAECCEIPFSQYEDYFGTMYLDATSNPGDDALAGWVVGFCLCLIFGIAFVFVWLPRLLAFNKSVSVLERKGLLEQAAAELESGEYEQIGKDCCRLSRRFIYGKNTGFVAPYGDILWIYRRDTKKYGMTVGSALMVSTQERNQHCGVGYAGKNVDEDMTRIFVAIAQNNPNVLIGFTKENNQEYKNRKNAAKLG